MNSYLVQLGDRSYPICFAADFESLSAAVAPLVAGRCCALVSNPTVWPLYGRCVARAISDAGGFPVTVLLPDGEQYKTFSELESALDSFTRYGLTRDSVVIALGGGVIGDVAGFAAAVYMRGVTLIQIPTTLLAQVDSSVGGKTGVNLSAGKNLAGAFYQPGLVYINTHSLATLPIRECRAGYAEVIKYGVIADPALFALLEAHTLDLFASLDAPVPVVPEILNPIIHTCCARKADIVSRDERETGLRAILNYGHTFGHAIEALTNYTTFVHGEAVAIGMHAAAVYACNLGLCTEELVERQQRLLLQAGLPIAFPRLPVDDVIAAFSRDKKAGRAALRFVLPVVIGSVEIVKNPDPDLLRETIQDCMEAPG